MEWQRLSGIKISEQTPEKNAAFQKISQYRGLKKPSHPDLWHRNRRKPIRNASYGHWRHRGYLSRDHYQFLAQFDRTEETIHAAVYLHSLIGEHLAAENYVVLPTQISEALPKFMKDHSLR